MTQAKSDGKMISVFGGSQCRPGDREYEEAREVGRLLAEAGYVVCTGGYQGTMAAASQGAFEAGGSAVGVTMAQLTSRVNDYLTETRPTPDFYQRLQALIIDSAGFVVLRGGIGTVVELALVWNKLTTHILTPRPARPGRAGHLGAMAGRLRRDTGRGAEAFGVSDPRGNARRGGGSGHHENPVKMTV